MGKNDYYNTLLTVLGPHMKLLSDIGGSNSTEANQAFAKANANYDQVLDFYKTIMSGSRENILKNLDASGVTRAYDEQERQNYELAPRGGRRAATAANLDFNKMSELNKLLQYLRGQAPGQIANVAQALSAQGSSRMGISLSALNSVTNLRAGMEGTKAEIEQREADRKAALIGSIFSAAGSVAGAWLGGK